MSHRAARLVAGLALTAAAAGCSSSGPFLSGRTQVGTLKANVAQLERERNQSQAKLAELEQDNRKMADKLAQEREENGELAARLDDARVLLSEQGIDTRSTASSFEVGRSARGGATEYELDRDSEPTERKKAPFAQIGGIRAVPYPEQDRTAAGINEDDIPPPARPAASASRPSESPLRWLPVVD